MKNLLIVAMTMLLLSCQKEELTIIQEQEDTEEVANASSNLRVKLRSISSHDGSFDDVIDGAPCISTKLPYTIFLNGETYNIGTILDLQSISAEDEVAIVFPATLIRSDHSEIVVNSEIQWREALNQCGDDVLTQEHNACVDLAYPISVATYNVLESQFETREISNSKELFPLVVNPQSEDLLSINYPVDLIIGGGSALRISNNKQLADTISALESACD